MRKVALVVVAGALVAGCGRRRAAPEDAAPAAKATKAEVLDVVPFVEQMRAAPTAPLGKRVRVRGTVADEARYGYDTTKTRIDIVPTGKALPYVMCLGSERRDTSLGGLKGRDVVVEGTVGPMAIDFPVLKGCHVVEGGGG